jgi:hypothetical protein
MKFRLLFEGEIPPRQQTTLKVVHDIRLQLAPQLEALWRFAPLNQMWKQLKHPQPGPMDYSILEQRGTSVFVPLISKRNDLMCELDVTFLRPQAPGQLLGDGGDIDNRVKTLLDALSVPPPAQTDFHSAIGPSRPVYCVLQDDSLVTKLAVETDRLLRTTTGRFDLVAILQVTIRAAKVTYGTLALLG